MTSLSHKKDKVTPFRFLGLFFIFCLFFSPLMAQEYAFMYIDNGSTSTTVGTSWTTVGTFSSTISSANWSYASNTLTASSADSVEGMYLIKYSLSFNAGAAIWSVGLSIDGAAPTEPIFTRSISSGKEADHGNMSGALLVNITKNQTLEMQVKNNTGSLSFTPVDVQVVAVKVKETSVNYYAGMNISSDQTFIDLSDPAGTYVKLTGFSGILEMNDWTFSSSELTAGSSAAGVYYAALSVSFTGDDLGVNIPDCSFRIVKNGSPVNISAIRKTSSTDIGNVAAAGLISISASDVISIEAAQDIRNNDLIVKKASLSLYKLTGDSNASYAGMKVTSDQTVTISAQNTWTTVGTYTLDAASGWSFDTDVFTPSSVSTYGYSFIDYSLSVMTANTSGDDVELCVFIGSNIHPEFTTMRRLSSNTSVGAVSGNGIFKVDGPDSTITLKVRNTTSANNFTIKKSYLAATQFRYVSSDTPLPIRLNNFSAVQENNLVQLSWETASETDNALFLIYRDDEVIASLPGAGTASEPHYYHYTDNYAIPGKTYTYTLADVSYSNVEVKHEDHAVRLVISEGNIGKDYSIGKAYPNPFNPSTIIPVNLAREAKVNAKMYDLGGHEIMSIFDGSMNAGSHELRVESENLSAGVYLVLINIEGISTIRKISLMK